MSSLCLPDSWLQYFNDLQLVAVLAAHREDPGLSEVQCAERTRLNRKTVHAKKRELLELRLLRPMSGGSGRGWQGLPCGIDSEKIHELVEKHSQLPQNGQFNCPETDNQLPQKGQFNCPETDNQLPQKGQSIVHKRTDASSVSLVGSASLAFQLAGTDEAVEKKLLKEAITDAIQRSGLRRLGNKELDTSTLTTLTSDVFRLYPDIREMKRVIDTVEAKCRDYLRHPGKAKSWGILVTAVRGEVGPERKPAAMDTVELQANLKAAAARMGGKR